MVELLIILLLLVVAAAAVLVVLQAAVAVQVVIEQQIMSQCLQELIQLPLDQVALVVLVQLMLEVQTELRHLFLVRHHLH
jgi:hypothetical protein